MRFAHFINFTLLQYTFNWYNFLHTYVFFTYRMFVIDNFSLTFLCDIHTIGVNTYVPDEKHYRLQPFIMKMFYSQVLNIYEIICMSFFILYKSNTLLKKQYRLPSFGKLSRFFTLFTKLIMVNVDVKLQRNNYFQSIRYLKKNQEK